MLFPTNTLTAIEAGAVTLAFRRWQRPRVRPGAMLRTLVGLVEVTAVDEVDPTDITDTDAHDAGFATRAELLAFLASRPEGAVYRVAVRHAGPDPRILLRQRDDFTDIELAEVLGRLAHLDRAARRSPWTAQLLRLIAEHPAVRAPDLAERVGWEPASFKRHVRVLKELGLTESLATGYRLSPRGRAVLDAVDQRQSP